MGFKEEDVIRAMQKCGQDHKDVCGICFEYTNIALRASCIVFIKALAVQVMKSVII